MHPLPLQAIVGEGPPFLICIFCEFLGQCPKNRNRNLTFKILGQGPKNLGIALVKLPAP